MAVLRLAYADPPYLGCCALYDHHHPDGSDDQRGESCMSASRDLAMALFHAQHLEAALDDWWRSILAETGVPAEKPIEVRVRARELREQIERLCEVTEVMG